MTNEEICTRIKVAYEQLGKVHTGICRSHPKREDTEITEILYDIQDILNDILKVEVKLGMIKREEDIR